MVFALFLSTASGADATAKDIEALKKQIDEIQRQSQEQIEELRKKVEELEAKSAIEMKRVEDLVSKQEDEEKDAWWKNVKAGYKKGFFIQTPDKNFKIKMKVRSQFQFSIDDTDDENTETNFRIRRLRLAWQGNAFRPWLKYKVQLDASDEVELKTMLLEAVYPTRYGNVLVPRIGQFKVPFNREELNSSAYLQLVERSVVNKEFAFGRDIGAALYGVIGNYLTYGAGVFNGDGDNGRSKDSNLLYVGRVQLTPCCGELEYGGTFPSGGDYEIRANSIKSDKPLIAFAVSFAGMGGLDIERKTPDSDLDERIEEIFDGTDARPVSDIFSISSDVSFRYRRISFEGEYNARWIDPRGIGEDKVFDQGFRVQGGFFLMPKFIEIAARYAIINFDDDIAGRDNVWDVTTGLNFYLSKTYRLKIQLSYSFIREEFHDSGDVDSNVFRTQFQAYF